MNDDRLLTGNWQLLPETRDALRLAQVERLIEREDWDEAVLEAEELLDLDPTNLMAQLRLAEALLQTDDAENAIDLLTALADHTGDPGVLFLLARAQFELCELQTAYATCRDVLRMEPGAAAPHYLMGLCLERMPNGSIAGASSSFAAAMQLEPDRYRFPLQLSDEDWPDLVRQAVEAMPRVLQHFWSEVPVTLEDWPDLVELTRNSPPLSPRVAALYAGDRDEEQDGWTVRPEQLRIYCKNLAHAENEADLVQQLAEALVREAADWLQLPPDEMSEAS